MGQGLEWEGLGNLWAGTASQACPPQDKQDLWRRINRGRSSIGAGVAILTARTLSIQLAALEVSKLRMGKNLAGTQEFPP